MVDIDHEDEVAGVGWEFGVDECVMDGDDVLAA